MFQDDRSNIGSYALKKAETEIPFPQDPLEDCIEHSLSDCGINQNKVNVKVVNHSIFDFCIASFDNTNNETINYGNLLSGEVSCYVPIDNILETSYQFQSELGSLSLFKDQQLPYPLNDTLKMQGNYSLHVAISSLNEDGLALLLIKDN